MEDDLIYNPKNIPDYEDFYHVYKKQNIIDKGRRTIDIKVNIYVSIGIILLIFSLIFIPVFVWQTVIAKDFTTRFCLILASLFVSIFPLAVSIVLLSLTRIKRDPLLLGLKAEQKLFSEVLSKHPELLEYYNLFSIEELSSYLKEHDEVVYYGIKARSYNPSSHYVYSSSIDDSNNEDEEELSYEEREQLAMDNGWDEEEMSLEEFEDYFGESYLKKNK